jgi:IS605 OrfB family transposase
MIKTVKQYSKKLDKPTQIELESKAVRTARLMNWIYTKFIGNKSYYLIHMVSPTYLRDKVLGKEECSRFGLQTRSTASAIRDAVGNLKTLWCSVIKSIRDSLRDSEFNDHERHYVYTVLKYKEVFFCVINKRCLKNFEFKSDEHRDFILGLSALSYNDINYVKINKWIRKQVRKFKNKPVIKNARQFPISRFNRKGNIISLEGLKPRKPPKVKLTDSRKLNANRVVLRENQVEVHCTCEAKISKPEVPNEVGIDVGFRTLIATSSGNLYGEGFSELVKTYVDVETEKGKKRNRLRVLAEKRKLQGKIEKASNIETHNLGTKKFYKKSRRRDETIKNFVNRSLNEFFSKERPTSIVHEDLTRLEQKKGNGFSRKVRNQLCRWRKGYLQERLNFKSITNGSDLTAVNPAFTSQTCSHCGGFGERKGDKFSCPLCETTEQHADINAAKNVLARKYDSEIGLYTKYTKVKEILLSRVLSRSDQVHYHWTPKTLDTNEGELTGSLDLVVTQRANSSQLCYKKRG